MIFATGLSGTIGKFLPETVDSLNINLNDVQINRKNKSELYSASILHLAAKLGHLDSIKELESWKINVEGTAQLASQALDAGIEKFVFVSSSHVYKNSSEILFENSPIEPISFYGEQKASAEERLKEIFRYDMKKLAIVRVFSVLDFGMKPGTLGGRVEKILQGNSEEMIESSNDIRDFLTPSQVAGTLYEFCLRSDLSGTFNLSTGIGTSVMEATKLMTSTSLKKKLFDFDHKNSRVPRIIGNNEKLLLEMPELKLRWKYLT